MSEADRLTKLELIVDRMQKSSLQAGPGWVTAVWSVVGGLVAAAFFIAQLAAAQASLTKTVEALTERLDAHTSLPGHPTEIERINDLKEQLEKNDAKDQQQDEALHHK